jgi:23S rRNA (pseudouridine1915-N3)-methyltransferase
VKILIISPGKRHAIEYRTAIAEYETRLRSALPIDWLFPAVGTKESEGAAVLKAIQDDDTVLLLDETGKDIDSPGLAACLDRELNNGAKRLVIVIGGAFGVSEEVKERANHTYRLSALVFPHMLVRLILVEQLYRAWSIRAGGKYHHQ